MWSCIGIADTLGSGLGILLPMSRLRIDKVSDLDTLLRCALTHFESGTLDVWVTGLGQRNQEILLERFLCSTSYRKMPFDFCVCTSIVDSLNLNLGLFKSDLVCCFVESNNILPLMRLSVDI